MFYIDSFNEIIDKILLEENINIKELALQLWMDKSHLKSLVEKGHEIGLHSHTHSHPFKMALLNKND